MVSPHQQRHADFGLRASGVLLCGIAYVAFARLAAMDVPPQSAGAIAYGLAAIGFLCASAGSAMTIHGHHLFDRIEVSQRWRNCPQTNTRSLSQPELMAIMDRSDVELLVVGMDADGSWTVRGSEGRLLGRFATGQAAQHYARNQRRQRPAISIASSSGHPRRLEGRLTLASARGSDVVAGNA